MITFKEMFIYKITNIVNNKVYVGLTRHSDVTRRWKAHKKALVNNYHHNKHLQSSWNKHGAEAFVFQIIEKTNTDMNFDLEQLERYWINHYDSMNPKNGYNKTDGGNSNKKVSPETIEKIRKANKGQVPWCKGKKLGPPSIETRRKISESKMNRPSNVSPGGKANQLSALAPYWIKRRKPIVGERKTSGENIHFESIVEAVRCGFTQSEISKCCGYSFKKYSHKGFFWRFRDNAE